MIQETRKSGYQEAGHQKIKESGVKNFHLMSWDPDIHYLIA